MSIEITNCSLESLNRLRGFEQEALDYAKNIKCPFYSFLTTQYEHEFSERFVICQIYRIKNGNLEPTIPINPQETIPCYILSSSLINTLASKKFFSHPEQADTAQEFDIFSALIFAGPYQYFFGERIPDTYLHLNENDLHRKKECNICNFQSHAISALPEILSEVEPKSKQLLTELQILVNRCLEDR